MPNITNLQIAKHILQQKIRSIRFRQKAAEVGLKKAMNNGDYFRHRDAGSRSAFYQFKQKCWEAELAAVAEESAAASAELQKIDAKWIDES